MIITRICKRGLLPLMLLTLASLSLQAVDEYNGVEIKLLPYLGVKYESGYREHGFLLRNNAEAPRKVVLAIESNSSPYGNSLERMSRTVVVPAGSTIRTSILQPPLNCVAPRVVLSVDGQNFKDGSIRPSTGNVSSHWGNESKQTFLVSQTLPPNANGTTFSMVPVMFGNQSNSGSIESKLQFEWSSLPVEQWSDSWLAYSGYDGIMIDNADMNKMPTAVRDALNAYVASGGTLVIFGTVAPVQSLAPESEGREMKLCYSGLGVTAYSSRMPSLFKEGDWAELHAIAAPTQELSTRSPKYLGGSVEKSFQVMDGVKVPFRQLFVIMLLFVVIIGPVNIFILSRRKKMIWLLWTTPAIAIAFSLMVVVYSFLSEGWYSRVRNNTLTILDEGAQLGATIGYQGFYCPLPPGEGFRYSSSAMICPVYNDAQHQCTIDWSEGQRLVSGWVRSRIPEYFLIRQVESRRERLKVVSMTPAAAEVVNGLGAELEELQLVGPDLTLYKASAPVLPGQKVTLRASGKYSQHQNAPRFTRSISENLLNALANYSTMVKMLRPGSYCARMKNTPFLPPGIKPGELSGESLIYGIMPQEGGVK